MLNLIILKKRGIQLKTLLKVILIVFGAYFVYLIATVFVYTKIKINSVTNQQKKSESSQTVDSKKISSGHEAVVIHELDDALAVRCDLIDSAKETLFVSQYSIKSDDSGVIFMGKLLDAADRGVKIQLLVNNLSTKMKNSERTPVQLFQNHPNIEIKGVGGINLLKPWTMNNVMHDKLIIVDDEYLLSSGRNTEDRFLLPDTPEEATNDRDVIIQNIGDDKNNSIIAEAKTYYHQLWNQKAAVKKTHKNLISKKTTDLDETFRKDYASTQQKREKQINHTTLQSLDFVSIENAQLISNGVGTIVKTPGVLNGINAYISNSEKDILVQTPYIIVTKQMNELINNWNSDIPTTIMTNSEKASPNVLAISGYEHQKKLLEDETTIFEYIGKGSLHQKSIAIDDNISMMGSFNFDSRSTFLSSENFIVIEGKEINQQLRDSIQENEDDSIKSTESDTLEIPAIKKALVKVLSWFSPLFNYLL